MRPWRLRDLEAADLEQVAGAERELFGAEAWSLETLAAELRAATGCWGPADRRYLVAETGVPEAAGETTGKALIGYAGVWTGDGRGDADLLTIATVSAWRRRGVAGALLDVLSAHARQVGCRHLLLEVRESNTGAQRLYAGRGLKVISRRRRYYRHPTEDALVMRLDLEAPPENWLTGVSPNVGR